MSAIKAALLSTEQRVIASVVQWLNQSKSVWLCTIVSTWGSSPRPAGSMLAFQAESGMVGSLSGGCIEEALVRDFTASPKCNAMTDQIYLYEYAISNDDQQQYKLPCGGHIKLLIERIEPSLSLLEHFKKIENALTLRQRICRTISLSNGERALSTNNCKAMGSSVAVSAQSVMVCFGPVFKMLLLGAGEVSYSVANIAKSVDFAVTICDPREAFLQGYQQAGVELIRCLPDDLIRERFSDEYTAVLALAHDPRVDDMALMEALKTKAFYIGAMGSLKTSDARRKRLMQLACTEAEIKQLHSPIGFNIGSKKPTEIAISILAQVLAEKQKFLGRLVNAPETTSVRSLSCSN